MLNRVSKSKATSNTHQTVCHTSEAFAETAKFLGTLHSVYGTKRPIRYYSCCNTFAVWKGRRGYPAHPSEPAPISAFLDQRGVPEASKISDVLALHNWADAQRICIPGFDLEHADFQTLDGYRNELALCSSQSTPQPPAKIEEPAKSRSPGSQSDQATQ